MESSAMDDDMMGDFDPYDLIQEHNLLINRTIKVINKQERLISLLSKQNEQLSELMLQQNQRIDKLERFVINLLPEEK